MMEFYNSRIVTARKDHKCDLCNGLIRKNEKYHRYAGKYDGDFFDNKYHLTCQNIINAFCDDTGDNEYSEDYIADWLHDKYCTDCDDYESDSCNPNILLCPKIRSHYRKE